MGWTDQHQTLLEAFVALFGLPPWNDDDAARAWTYRLAQQFNFSFPSEGWGTKSGGQGRPPSTDVICTRSPFVGYDVIVGQGDPSQTMATMPGPIGLAGQVFIETPAADHLGIQTTVPPPPTTPPVTPPTVTGCKFVPAVEAEFKLAVVSSAVEGLIESQRALHEKLAAIYALVVQNEERREVLVNELKQQVARAHQDVHKVRR